MVALAVGVTVPATPVAAEGLFEFLFGGFRRSPPKPEVNLGRQDDAFRSLFNDRQRPVRRRETVRGAAGPGAAFCVRLCDGRYFPIQGRRDFSAAEQCNSFCPASETKVFAGRSIAYATAADGQRYADLPNAFVYRERLVPGCGCDGKDRVGVAQVPVAEDPTLQRGDIVVTNSGFTVYNGRNPRQQGAFTPLDAAKVSKSVRDRLENVKIAPQQPPVADRPVSIASSAVRETTGIAPADGGGVTRAQ